MNDINEPDDLLGMLPYEIVAAFAAERAAREAAEEQLEIERMESAPLADAYRQLHQQIAALREAIRAFAGHHDNGQAGQPGFPITYGELDIWEDEWDRRYAALRALLAAPDGEAT